MERFKTFYEKQINEDLGDVLGDIKDAASAKIKSAASNAFSPTTKKVFNRLFNIENDIVKLTFNGKYKELGSLLINKKIPQDFKFKRITLFGKNPDFKSNKKTYRDIPLFFVILSVIIDLGKSKDLQSILSAIESAGIDITTYLNRLDSSNNDIISFLLVNSNNSNISSDPNIPSNFEKTCINAIKTLLIFGHRPQVSNDAAVINAVRMQSLPIFKAFFESKYAIKITPEIQRAVDKVNNPNFISYLSNKSSKDTSVDKLKGIDLSSFGYDINSPTGKVQTLTQSNALNLLIELAKALKAPYDKTKLDNISKNKSALKLALMSKLSSLKLPKDIEIK